MIIDTAGKLLDFMTNYIIQEDPKMAKRDGSLQLQGYGARKTLFVSFLRQVAALGKHLVFVAHEKEEKEGDLKVIRPEIGGSSAGDLIKELDLVGYMQSIGDRKMISFEPCEKFYGKNTCKLPPRIELINTLEENKPNGQLSGIFDKFQKSLEERKKLAIDYSELLDIINAKVESIAAAETANEVSEWAQNFDGHIWDSKLQAAMRISHKTKELGLKLNKDSKKYEDPAPVVPPAAQSNPGTHKPDAKGNPGSKNPQNGKPQKNIDNAKSTEKELV